MDFKLNEMEQEILDMLHDFCLKEVKPIAAELDEKEEFTQNAREKLAEMGMLGTYIPEEYGGAGLSYLTYIVCCEELAKYCASTSIMFSVHGSLCSWPILEFGTEEQKQKYLVPLAQGEKLGAMGLTEPGAGTDANGVRTTAVLKGDKYILNGTKIDLSLVGCHLGLDGGEAGLIVRLGHGHSAGASHLENLEAFLQLLLHAHALAILGGPNFPSVSNLGNVQIDLLLLI